MKNANQTNNKTIAAAMIAAAAQQGKTISGLKCGLPSEPVYKVDLVKRAPAKSAAMASVVESAKVVAKGKPENYPPEVSAALLADWAASDQSKEAVQTLATKFGKAARSIVAKLSREGVYKKQEYKTKTGGVPVSKEQHVTTIAAFMGVDASKLESLEKANKTVLVLVEGALKDGAHAFDNRESEESKANKAAMLVTLYDLIGADKGELDSLKLASKEALSILVNAFTPEFDQSDDINEGNDEQEQQAA